MDQDFIRPDELPSSDDDGDSDDAMDTDGSDAGGDIGDLITKLLDAKKAKSDAEGGPRKKRKLAEERTEAYAEGEFALPTRGSGRLDLGTLVSALSEEKDLGKLKGQAVRLRTDNEESKRETAPLPAREKARIERQAGYSTVAEEVDRYQLLVERNRNAVNLHFDLVDERSSQSTAAMVSDFKPASKLDKAIASIVDDSQFDDNKTMGQMELPDHVLDKEEVARRQKELRWMRELAFRQELKAKRHAKIKSKSFRKILKKERERTKEEDLQRLLESDPDAAREHLIKLELDRAKARMTQKGKLKSKWTAMMARNGELAERSAGLSREQILDQIKEAEDLQKRIHGVGNDDSDSDADNRNGRGNADSDDGASDDDDALPTKGVFGMKFMQRAAEAEALRQANAGRDDFDGSDADEDQVVGRRTVGSGINPAGIVVGNDEPFIESVLAEPASRNNGKQQKKQHASSSSSAGHQVSAADITFTVNTGSDDGAEDNPWAAGGSGTDRSATSSKLGKLQKKQQKQLATMAARSDASEGKSKPVLDLDVVNTVVAANHDSDDDSDADVDGARRAGTGKAGGSRVAFKQTELVSMAFAGDDVVREFEEEKAQLEDAEAGKVVDLTLPGWGSWGGEGLKAKTNVVVKKIAGVDKDKRKDSGMGHVIISEKRQKKLTKYMATSIPHPYQSRAQYEAAMRQTIGKEWVTSESMNALTLPKITKAQGVVIKPLKFNKAEAEAWGDKKKAARSENNKLAVKKQKKQQQQQQQS
ncbi:small-subunit processome [Catenaria anguillulae PL171]|uniref:Small-subunit processome n=1 Tax=Catenaria anguillulae PL171 TaxID=765915 RepID=A0A1Y2HJ08_9FUNG|nr:small-subunit processome [Catenaria anguillulae PL171]